MSNTRPPLGSLGHLLVGMALENVTWPELGHGRWKFVQQNNPRIRIGLREGPSRRRRGLAETKCLRCLKLCEMPTRGSNLAGRQGVFPAVFRKPNKNGTFSLKPHEAIDLALSDSFVAFRQFAAVFRFFKSNDTHNDTRRETLRSFAFENLRESPPTKLATTAHQPDGPRC